MEAITNTGVASGDNVDQDGQRRGHLRCTGCRDGGPTMLSLGDQICMGARDLTPTPVPTTATSVIKSNPHNRQTSVLAPSGT